MAMTRWHEGVAHDPLLSLHGCTVLLRLCRLMEVQVVFLVRKLVYEAPVRTFLVEEIAAHELRLCKPCLPRHNEVLAEISASHPNAAVTVPAATV